MVITVIIFSGAQGRENSRIFPCQFPHITYILRGYRILSFWFWEIWCKDLSLFLLLFIYFYFDALQWLELMQLRSRPTRLQFSHWGKKALNLKKKNFFFPYRSARELFLFSFGREPEESDAILLILCSWCLPWCWPAKFAQLLLDQFFGRRKETA